MDGYFNGCFYHWIFLLGLNLASVIQFCYGICQIKDLEVYNFITKEFTSIKIQWIFQVSDLHVNVLGVYESI